MRLLVIGVLVILLVHNQTPIAPITQQENIFKFGKLEGVGFNNTNASYFGMGNKDIKVLVVAGSDKDNETLKLYLRQKVVDFALTNGTATLDVPSEITTIIEYPFAMVFDQNLNNKSASFSNLNWTITHTEGLISQTAGKLVVNASTVLNGPVYGDLEGLHISIEYILTLIVTEGVLSIPLYTIDGNETTRTGFREKKGWFVQTSIKINHAYHHPNLGSYNFIVQPFNLNYKYRVVVPKVFTRPTADLNSSEVTNNDIRIHLSKAFRSNYEWNQTVAVDGQAESVIVNNLYTFNRFRLTEYDKVKVFSYNYLSGKYFRYPAGNSVIHDPQFGSFSFIQLPPANDTSATSTSEFDTGTTTRSTTGTTQGSTSPSRTSIPINFDTDLQFNSQLVGLLVISVIFILSLLFYRKR